MNIEKLLTALPQDELEAMFEFCRRVEAEGLIEELPQTTANRLNNIINAMLERNGYERIARPYRNDANDTLIGTLNVISGLEADYKVGSLFESISENRDPLGVVELNADEKSMMRDKLNDIRGMIDDSELSDRKKNALYRRIGDLEKEIDMVSTRTDRFFSFLGDLAFTAGEMAEKSKPVADRFSEIMEVILRRRAESENVSLPKRMEKLLSDARSEKEEE
ncbi:hypothetical protein [Maricaulis sp.]|uniref:hypothetical protein n=1 Tax=Maricaulis sp. TaxID=1486257 RepID=UPI0032993C9C